MLRCCCSPASADNEIWPGLVVLRDSYRCGTVFLYFQTVTEWPLAGESMWFWGLGGAESCVFTLGVWRRSEEKTIEECQDKVFVPGFVLLKEENLEIG